MKRSLFYCNKTIRFIKCLSIALIITLITENLAMAAGSSASGLSVQSTSNRFMLPKDLAEQTAVRAGSGPMVVHIQDAHDSLDAQKSIGKILDLLMRQYKIDLVGLEGSSGVVDPAMISSFPDKAVREKVADALLADTKISAAEFYKIIEAGHFETYGVEDQALYRSNLQAYQELLKDQENLAKPIFHLKNALATLERQILSKKLQKVLGLERAHKSDNKGFTDYWTELVRILPKDRMPLETFPHMAKLVEITEMEAKISFPEAEKNREKLMSELSRRSGEDERRALIQKALAFKTSKASPAEFHNYLFKVAASKGLASSDYPELKKYTQYVQAYEKLDVLHVSREMDAFGEALFEAMQPSEDEKEFYGLTRYLETLSKLLEARATSAEEAYLSGEGIWSLEKARTYIEKAASRLGLEMPGLDFEVIKKAEPLAKTFYERVHARNEAMLKNLTSRMAEKKTQVAVLVTGGFHADGLSDLMARDQISHVVYMPKFDSEEGKRPYAVVITSRNSYLDQRLRVEAQKEAIVMAMGLAVLAGKGWEDVKQSYLENYRKEAKFTGESAEKVEAQAEKKADNDAVIHAKSPVDASESTLGATSVFAGGLEPGEVLSFIEGLSLVGRAGQGAVTVQTEGGAWDVVAPADGRRARVAPSTRSVANLLDQASEVVASAKASMPDLDMMRDPSMAQDPQKQIEALKAARADLLVEAKRILENDPRVTTAQAKKALEARAGDIVADHMRRRGHSADGLDNTIVTTQVEAVLAEALSSEGRASRKVLDLSARRAGSYRSKTIPAVAELRQAGARLAIASNAASVAPASTHWAVRTYPAAFDTSELLSGNSQFGEEAPPDVKAELYSLLLKAVRDFRLSGQWQQDVFRDRRDATFVEVLERNGFYESTYFETWVNTLLTLKDKNASQPEAVTLRRLQVIGDENTVAENVREFTALLDQEYLTQDIKIKGVTPSFPQILRNVHATKIPLVLFEFVIEQISESFYTFVGALAGGVLGYFSPVWLGHFAGSFLGDAFSIPEEPTQIISWNFAGIALGGFLGFHLSKRLQIYADGLEVKADAAAEGYLNERRWAYIEDLNASGLSKRRQDIREQFQSIRTRYQTRKQSDNFIFTTTHQDLLSKVEQFLLGFREDESWVDEALLAADIVSKTEGPDAKPYHVAIAVLAEIEDAYPGYLESFFERNKTHNLRRFYLDHQRVIEAQSVNSFVWDNATRAAREVADAFVGTLAEKEAKFDHELNQRLNISEGDRVKDAAFYEHLLALINGSANYDDKVFNDNEKMDVIVTLSARVKALEDLLGDNRISWSDIRRAAAQSDISEFKTFVKKLRLGGARLSVAIAAPSPARGGIFESTLQVKKAIYYAVAALGVGTLFVAVTANSFWVAPAFAAIMAAVGYYQAAATEAVPAFRETTGTGVSQVISTNSTETNRAIIWLGLKRIEQKIRQAHLAHEKTEEQQLLNKKTWIAALVMTAVMLTGGILAGLSASALLPIAFFSALFTKHIFAPSIFAWQKDGYWQSLKSFGQGASYLSVGFLYHLLRGFILGIFEAKIQTYGFALFAYTQQLIFPPSGQDRQVSLTKFLAQYVSAQFTTEEMLDIQEAEESRERSAKKSLWSQTGMGFAAYLAYEALMLSGVVEFGLKRGAFLVAGLVAMQALPFIGLASGVMLGFNLLTVGTTVVTPAIGYIPSQALAFTVGSFMMPFITLWALKLKDLSQYAHKNTLALINSESPVEDVTITSFSIQNVHQLIFSTDSSLSADQKLDMAGYFYAVLSSRSWGRLAAGVISDYERWVVLDRLSAYLQEHGYGEKSGSSHFANLTNRSSVGGLRMRSFYEMQTDPRTWLALLAGTPIAWFVEHEVSIGVGAAEATGIKAVADVVKGIDGDPLKQQEIAYREQAGEIVSTSEKAQAGGALGAAHTVVDVGYTLFERLFGSQTPAPSQAVHDDPVPARSNGSSVGDTKTVRQLIDEFTKGNKSGPSDTKETPASKTPAQPTTEPKTPQKYPKLSNRAAPLVAESDPRTLMRLTREGTEEMREDRGYVQGDGAAALKVAPAMKVIAEMLPLADDEVEKLADRLKGNNNSPEAEKERRAAILKLGESQNPKAAKALQKLLSRYGNEKPVADPGVSVGAQQRAGSLDVYTASFAAGWLSDTVRHSITGFMGLFNEENASLRASAAWALGELAESVQKDGQRRDIVDDLERAISRDPDPTVRAAAALASGEYADVRGRIFESRDPRVDTYAKALQDPDWRVRFFMLRSLTEAAGSDKARDMRMDPLITNAIQKESNFFALSAALRAAGEHGMTSAVPSIVERIRTLPVSEDWTDLVEKQVLIDSIVTALEKISGEDADLRADIAQQLAILKAQETDQKNIIQLRENVVPIVDAYLKSASAPNGLNSDSLWMLRMQQVSNAFGEKASDLNAAQLADALFSSRDAEQRIGAARYLLEKNPHLGLSLLDKALKQESDPQVKAWIAVLLSSLPEGQDQYFWDSRDAWGSEIGGIIRDVNLDWMMRAAVLEAAGKAGYPQALSGIRQILGSEGIHPELQRSAMDVVRQLDATSRTPFVPLMVQNLFSVPVTGDTVELTGIFDSRRAGYHQFLSEAYADPDLRSAVLTHLKAEISRTLTPSMLDAVNSNIIPLIRDLDPDKADTELQTLFKNYQLPARNPQARLQLAQAAEAAESPYLQRVHSMESQYADIAASASGEDMIRVIKDPQSNSSQRFLAAHRLGEMSDARSVGVLRELAEKNSDPLVRAAAIRSLTRMMENGTRIYIGDEDPVLKLYETIIKNPEDPDILKHYVLDALSVVSDSRSLNITSRLITDMDSHPALARHAVGALENYSPQELAAIAVQPLVEAYSKTALSGYQQQLGFMATIRGEISRQLMRIAQDSPSSKKIVLQAVDTQIQAALMKKADTTDNPGMQIVPELLQELQSLKGRIQDGGRAIVKAASVQALSEPPVPSADARPSEASSYKAPTASQATAFISPAAPAAQPEPGRPRTRPAYPEDIVRLAAQTLVSASTVQESVAVTAAVEITSQETTASAAVTVTPATPQVTTLPTRSGLDDIYQEMIGKSIAKTGSNIDIRGTLKFSGNRDAVIVAAHQAGLSQSTMVLPDLVKQLRNEDPNIRITSARALAAYDFHRILVPAGVADSVVRDIGEIAIKPEADFYERAQMIQTLGRFKNSSAVQYLSQVMTLLENYTGEHADPSKAAQVKLLRSELFNALREHTAAGEDAVFNQLRVMSATADGLGGAGLSTLEVAQNLNPNRFLEFISSNIRQKSQKNFEPTRFGDGYLADLRTRPALNAAVEADVIFTVPAIQKSNSESDNFKAAMDQLKLPSLGRFDQLMDDRDPNMRAALAYALGLPQLDAGVLVAPALIEAARSERNPKVLGILMWALSQTAPPANNSLGDWQDHSVPVISDILKLDAAEYRYARAWAAFALARSTDPGAEVLLTQLMNDRDPYVAVRAIQATRQSTFAVKLFPTLLKIPKRPDIRVDFLQYGSATLNRFMRSVDLGPVHEAATEALKSIANEHKNTDHAPTLKSNILAEIADNSILGERYYVYRPILERLDPIAASDNTPFWEKRPIPELVLPLASSILFSGSYYLFRSPGTSIFSFRKKRGNGNGNGHKRVARSSPITISEERENRPGTGARLAQVSESSMHAAYLPYYETWRQALTEWSQHRSDHQRLAYSELYKEAKILYILGLARKALMENVFVFDRPESVEHIRQIQELITLLTETSNALVKEYTNLNRPNLTDRERARKEMIVEAMADISQKILYFERYEYMVDQMRALQGMKGYNLSAILRRLYSFSYGRDLAHKEAESNLQELYRIGNQISDGSMYPQFRDEHHLPDLVSRQISQFIEEPLKEEILTEHEKRALARRSVTRLTPILTYGSAVLALVLFWLDGSITVSQLMYSAAPITSIGLVVSFLAHRYWMNGIVIDKRQFDEKIRGIKHFQSDFAVNTGLPQIGTDELKKVFFEQKLSRLANDVSQAKKSQALNFVMVAVDADNPREVEGVRRMVAQSPMLDAATIVVLVPEIRRSEFLSMLSVYRNLNANDSFQSFVGRLLENRAVTRLNPNLRNGDSLPDWANTEVSDLRGGIMYFSRIEPSDEEPSPMPEWELADEMLPVSIPPSRSLTRFDLALADVQRAAHMADMQKIGLMVHRRINQVFIGDVYWFDREGLQMQAAYASLKRVAEEELSAILTDSQGTPIRMVRGGESLDYLKHITQSVRANDKQSVFAGADWDLDGMRQMLVSAGLWGTKLNNHLLSMLHLMDTTINDLQESVPNFNQALNGVRKEIGLGIEELFLIPLILAKQPTTGRNLSAYFEHLKAIVISKIFTDGDLIDEATQIEAKDSNPKTALAHLKRPGSLRNLIENLFDYLNRNIAVSSAYGRRPIDVHMVIPSPSNLYTVDQLVSAMADQGLSVDAVSTPLPAAGARLAKSLSGYIRSVNTPSVRNDLTYHVAFNQQFTDEVDWIEGYLKRVLKVINDVQWNEHDRFSIQQLSTLEPYDQDLQIFKNPKNREALLSVLLTGGSGRTAPLAEILNDRDSAIYYLHNAPHFIERIMTLIAENQRLRLKDLDSAEMPFTDEKNSDLAIRTLRLLLAIHAMQHDIESKADQQATDRRATAPETSRIAGGSGARLAKSVSRNEGLTVVVPIDAVYDTTTDDMQQMGQNLARTAAIIRTAAPVLTRQENVKIAFSLPSRVSADHLARVQQAFKEAGGVGLDVMWPTGVTRSTLGSWEAQLGGTPLVLDDLAGVSAKGYLSESLVIDALRKYSDIASGQIEEAILKDLERFSTSEQKLEYLGRRLGSLGPLSLKILAALKEKSPLGLVDAGALMSVTATGIPANHVATPKVAALRVNMFLSEGADQQIQALTLQRELIKEQTGGRSAIRPIYIASSEEERIQFLALEQKGLVSSDDFVYVEQSELTEEAVYQAVKDKLALKGINLAPEDLGVAFSMDDTAVTPSKNLDSQVMAVDMQHSNGNFGMMLMRLHDVILMRGDIRGMATGELRLENGILIFTPKPIDFDGPLDSLKAVRESVESAA